MSTNATATLGNAPIPPTGVPGPAVAEPGIAVTDGHAATSGVAFAFLAQAVAVAVLAIAFAGGRSGDAWASTAYWIGQMALVLVPALIILRTPLTRATGWFFALTTGLATYAVTESYAPARFTFLDEFQHYESVANLVHSHHLLTVNTVLPISPQYPGLELVTSVLVLLGHMSIPAAGALVVGVAHVATLLGLYELGLLVRNGRPAVGCIAVVVYSIGPHYQFFDAYFIYSAMALPFLVWSLVCVVRSYRQPSRAWLWSAVAAALGGCCVVSHHITTYVLLAVVAAFAAILAVLREWGAVRRVVAVLVAVGAMLAVWVATVATYTVSYVSPVVGSLVGKVVREHYVVISSLDLPLLDRSASNPSPLQDRIWEVAGLGVLLAGLVAGLAWFGFRAWAGRWRQVDAYDTLLAVTALSLFVIPSVRLVDANSQELAGRMYTYALIPTGLFLGLIGSKFLASRFPRPAGRGLFNRSSLAVVSALAVVWMGNISAGWPNYYARLPGPYEAAAWERSVDPYVVAAATWGSRYLPRYEHIIGDQESSEVVASLADETPVPQLAAGVFLAGSMTPQVVTDLRLFDVTYIVVDRRIDQDLPLDGKYFTVDPLAGHYRSPLPRTDIDKFLTWSGGSVVYDNGVVAIVAVGRH